MLDYTCVSSWICCDYIKSRTLKSTCPYSVILVLIGGFLSFCFAGSELLVRGRGASKSCLLWLEMFLGQFTLSQSPAVDTVLGSWKERGLERDLCLCTGLFRELLKFLMEDKIETRNILEECLPVDLGEPPETAKQWKARGVDWNSSSWGMRIGLPKTLYSLQRVGQPDWAAEKLHCRAEFAWGDVKQLSKEICSAWRPQCGQSTCE